MATQFRDPAVGKSDEIHSTQKNPLLLEARGVDGSVWVYAQGVASCVAGSAVTYDEAGVTALVVANAIGPVGFAGAALVANTYGWFCVVSPSGGMSVNTDAGIVDNSKVYIDGTAGRVDDTVVTGDQLMGAVFRGTDTSNFALAQFNRPYVSDSLG